MLYNLGFFQAENLLIGRIRYFVLTANSHNILQHLFRKYNQFKFQYNHLCKPGKNVFTNYELFNIMSNCLSVTDMTCVQALEVKLSSRMTILQVSVLLIIT